MTDISTNCILYSTKLIYILQNREEFTFEDIKFNVDKFIENSNPEDPLGRLDDLTNVIFEVFIRLYYSDNNLVDSEIKEYIDNFFETYTTYILTNYKYSADKSKLLLIKKDLYLIIKSITKNSLEPLIFEKLDELVTLSMDDLKYFALTAYTRCLDINLITRYKIF